MNKIAGISNQEIVLEALSFSPKTKTEIIEFTNLTDAEVTGALRILNEKKKIHLIHEGKAYLLPKDPRDGFGKFRMARTQGIWAVNENFVPDEKSITKKSKSNQEKILESLSGGPKTYQEISDITGLKIIQVKNTLSVLVSKNLAVCIDQGTYALIDFDEEGTEFDSLLDEFTQKIRERTAQNEFESQFFDNKYMRKIYSVAQKYHTKIASDLDEEKRRQKMRELIDSYSGQESSVYSEQESLMDDEAEEILRRKNLSKMIDSYPGHQSSVYSEEPDFDLALDDFSRRLKENPQEDEFFGEYDL